MTLDEATDGWLREFDTRAQRITGALRAIAAGSDHGEELSAIAEALNNIAYAIYPPRTMGAHDDTDGYVSSLTEAMMGHTKALNNIAYAIQAHTEAVTD